MGIDLLPKFVRDIYEVHEWKHACAILQRDFPTEWEEVIDMLTTFRLKRSWLIKGGGRKSKISQAIDEFLHERGWKEKDFTTQLVVDKKVTDAPTHKIDCLKNGIALETE